MGNSALRCAGMTVVLFLLAVTAARADDDEPLDARILEELNKSTTVDFKGVDLDGAVEYFEDVHRGVKFEIDHEAFTEANIDLNKRLLTYKSPVEKKGTITISTFPLYAALWEMLESEHLSFMVKDNKVIFTTEKVAEQWQKKFRAHIAKQK